MSDNLEKLFKEFESINTGKITLNAIIFALICFVGIYNVAKGNPLWATGIMIFNILIFIFVTFIYPSMGGSDKLYKNIKAEEKTIAEFKKEYDEWVTLEKESSWIIIFRFLYTILIFFLIVIGTKTIEDIAFAEISSTTSLVSSESTNKNYIILQEKETVLPDGQKTFLSKIVIKNQLPLLFVLGVLIYMPINQLIECFNIEKSRVRLFQFLRDKEKNDKSTHLCNSKSCKQ